MRELGSEGAGGVRELGSWGVRPYRYRCSMLDIGVRRPCMVHDPWPCKRIAYCLLFTKLCFLGLAKNRLLFFVD